MKSGTSKIHLVIGINLHYWILKVGRHQKRIDGKEQALAYQVGAHIGYTLKTAEAP